MTGRLDAFTFPGRVGALEGLWKDAPPPRGGTAVVAHPHPLHGGTLHNKVVYRAAQALSEAGWATLRFNFRGVGLSEGRHDAGRGETDDFRAAMEEALHRGGPPLLAAGFSFGSAVALRASSGDPRVVARIAIGLPLATESGRDVPRVPPPALFVTGERDSFGPPDLLARFVGDSGQIVIVPQADHFFEGQLERLQEAIASFLGGLAKAERA
ncbi:MAG TPA: alpha/beta fold hydrolase [Thermoanaerobaculia bacterium]